MAGYVGLNECAQASLAGGETPVFVALDKLERGSLTYEGGESQENIGLGGQVAYYRDMVVPVGTASTMLQSLSLLQDTTGDPIYYFRPVAVGDLPTVIAIIQGGPITDEDAARQHESCYLRKVKFSCKRGGPVMVEYGWAALDETEKVTIAALDVAAKQTESPFVWHASTVEFDDTEFSCQSWDLEVTNDLAPQTSQDVKAGGAQRLPEWMDPGDYTVKLTATVRTNPGYDLSADFPTRFSFKFIGLNSDAAPLQFTLDCTGGGDFEKDGDPLELVAGGDEVLYQVSGKAVNDVDIVALTLEEAA